MKTVILDAHFSARPESVADARGAMDAIRGTADEETFEDARLLVSEVVTNSVRHAGLAPGTQIRVRVTADDDGVRCEVSDGGHGFVKQEHIPRPSAASGWGLFLVDSVAEAWGVQIDGSGTTVWFELTRRRDS